MKIQKVFFLFLEIKSEKKKDEEERRVFEYFFHYGIFPFSLLLRKMFDGSARRPNPSLARIFH